MIQEFADQVLRAMGYHEEVYVTSVHAQINGIYFTVRVPQADDVMTEDPSLFADDDVMTEDSSLFAMNASDLFPVDFQAADVIYFKGKSDRDSFLTPHQFIQKLKYVIIYKFFENAFRT